MLHHRITINSCKKLTHIRFVLEGVVAAGPHAMEVGSPLAAEGTPGLVAILGGSETLETLLHDGRVLPVVVGVHLDV